MLYWNMAQNDNVIKSAWEIALEKLKDTKVSDKELQEAEYFDEGKKIAVRFLKEEKIDLDKLLSAYPDSERKSVKEGFEHILYINVVLPKSERALKENRKAMEGLVIIKKKKQEAAQICNVIEEQLKNYHKQREEVYKQIKKQFEKQFEQTKQALEQQLGRAVNIEVGNQPEFQKQLKEIYAQLDSEYTAFLEEYKNQLKSIQ